MCLHSKQVAGNISSVRLIIVMPAAIVSEILTKTEIFITDFIQCYIYNMA